MNHLFMFGVTLATAAVAALLSYIASLKSTALAWKYHAVDEPKGGRKIHRTAIPQWGGLGITAVLVFLGILMFQWAPWSSDFVRLRQLAGFLLGVIILAIGGALDDKTPQKPSRQILFPALASIMVIASGTGIIQVTNPFHLGGLPLVWWQGYGLSLPSDLITFAWLMVATYATKIQDGLDGLVTGLAVIGSALVGALSLSLAFFQPVVAILSAIVGGSFLGFLPRNINPAKQFLGEAGSTIAGFSLGVLAILSSAKLAIALCVLAIPIADVALVVLGRLRRGAPVFQGDNTHLHFRLLRAGLGQKSAVRLLWCVSLLAGILALTLQTRGKIFIVIALVVFTALASFIAGIKAERLHQHED